MEITSPPYPRKNCNPTTLHGLLMSFAAWIEEHREWAQAKFKEMDAPADISLPDLSAIASQKLDRFKDFPVVDMYNAFQGMRTIRDRYDDIVRNYEDVELWESESCCYQRLMLLRSAAFFLIVAFLDPEKREAKLRELNGSNVQVLPLNSLPPDVLKQIFGNKAEGNISDADLSNLFNSDDLLGGDSQS